MDVAFRLYFRGRSLGDVTQTRRVHGVSKQQCWGRGNLMGHTAYAAQYYRYMCTLLCRIQR